MKKGDVFPIGDGAMRYKLLGRGRRLMVQYTGEKRRPKKGEWFLSGAVVDGYEAYNDLSQIYHIGELVIVETKEIKTITPYQKEK